MQFEDKRRQADDQIALLLEKREALTREITQMQQGQNESITRIQAQAADLVRAVETQLATMAKAFTSKSQQLERELWALRKNLAETNWDRERWVKQLTLSTGQISFSRYIRRVF